MNEDWQEFYMLMEHKIGMLLFGRECGGTEVQKALLQAWLVQNELGELDVKEWFTKTPGFSGKDGSPQ